MEAGVLAGAAGLAASLVLGQLAAVSGAAPALILLGLPVTLSALLGGLGPGLTATVTTAIGAGLYLIPLPDSLVIGGGYDRPPLITLIGHGVLVSALGEWLIRSRRSTAQRVRQLETQQVALSQGERMLRLALDAAGAGVWEVVPATGEFWASERALILHGLPPVTPMDHERALAPVHPDDRPRVEAALKSALATGAPFQLELRLPQPDGSWRWVESRAELQPDQDPPRLVGLVQDITARKQAEERLDNARAALAEQQARLEELVQARTAGLAASEAKFRALVEQSMVGIFIQQEGYFRYANQALAKLRGCTDPLDIIGHRCDEFVVPQERERIDAIARGLIQADYFTFRGLRADGTEIDIETWQRSIEHEGHPATIGLSVDITERCRLETIVRESEARQRLAMAAAHIGLWDWDILSNKVVYSREYKAQLGYTEDELGDGIDEWRSRVHPSDLGSMQTKADQLFSSADGSGFEAEFRMRHKDGSWRWIYTRAELLRDAHGRQVRMLGCHIDITERKHMEQALAASRQQQTLQSRRLLAIQEDERRRLARELHDEIGQVLTAVRLNLQSAQITADSDALRVRLRDCVDVTNQAIAQVRSRSLDLRPALLDDFGLIPAMEQFIARQRDRGTGLIELQAQPLTQRPSAQTEIACYRVMQEAVTNAMRHACAAGIRVTVGSAGDRLELRVQDDGRGFDPHTALRHALAGRSFGLLGMQERATLAGGGIELVSQPGGGCEVRAWFPLRENAA